MIKFWFNKRQIPKDYIQVIFYKNGLSEKGFYNPKDKRFYSERTPYKFPRYYLNEIDKWTYNINIEELNKSIYNS